MNDGSGLKYFLTDHLGSVVAVTDENGDLISQQHYLPFGGVRSDVNDITQTDYGYTGQRNLDSDIGLMDYNARFYSPLLNRFIQPDSIVPDPSNPQAWNRFSYVYGNPLRYIDPSGHAATGRTTICLDGVYCGLPTNSSYQNYVSPVSSNSGGNGNTPQYDITEFLVQEIQNAGDESLMLSEMYGEEGGFFFIYSYMFGKYWRYGPKNIKTSMLRDIGEGVILCGGDGCRWVDYSTPGNILFGYAVESVGMSEKFYSWVGGLEQIGDDAINPNTEIQWQWCLTSSCDDPYDLAAVQFGAQLYKDYKANITLGIFQNELTSDVLWTFQPPPSNFVEPFSPHAQGNNYMLGDFDYAP